jgi:hypothetical protein
VVCHRAHHPQMVFFCATWCRFVLSRLSSAPFFALGATGLLEADLGVNALLVSLRARFAILLTRAQSDILPKLAEPAPNCTESMQRTSTREVNAGGKESSQAGDRKTT